jgi:membrane-bound transcription factor site-1 protease
VDTEDEFYKTEIKKIYDDITYKGLSLIVFADWYNTSVIKSAKFFDENTRKWCTPITGYLLFITKFFYYFSMVLVN